MLTEDSNDIWEQSLYDAHKGLSICDVGVLHAGHTVSVELSWEGGLCSGV